MSKEYCHGESEDTAYWETGFKSREDAIESAKSDGYDYEGGFVTGVVRHATVTDFLPFQAHALLEAIVENEETEENFADQVHDAFLKPAYEKDPEAIARLKELDAALRVAFMGWWDKYGFAPNWFFVDDAQSHELPEVPTDA